MTKNESSRRGRDCPIWSTGKKDIGLAVYVVDELRARLEPGFLIGLILHSPRIDPFSPSMLQIVLKEVMEKANFE